MLRLHPGNDEAAALHAEMLRRRFHIRSSYTGVVIASAHTEGYAEILLNKYNENMRTAAFGFVLVDTHAQQAQGQQQAAA